MYHDCPNEGNLSSSYASFAIPERLLQFIWQFQYFNSSELSTTGGDRLQIIYQGQINTNQGPDFLDAKVRIGNTMWAGTIEVHVKSSGWKKHNHHQDDNYNSVILHVVWDDDEENENSMPVLELKERVPKILLQRYANLMKAETFIPCAANITVVPDLVWKSWEARLVAERLLRKTNTVQTYLQEANHHWEQAFWWLIARNFGMKVNADLFEKMARSVSLNILARHKNQIHQLEALLFGQLNLLDREFKDDYPKMLQKEYQFYKKKYGLTPVPLTPFFLRMRPVNFPTVRLAQLAMLIHESSHLFSKIRDAESVIELKKWFDIEANDYWHYHFRFDELSSFRIKRPGQDSISNIIINTIIPMLFAYGSYHDEAGHKEKAFHWLEQLAGENNNIIKQFWKLKIESRTAFDSQALIELKTEYCDRKRCLDCAVGNVILKGRSQVGNFK